MTETARSLVSEEDAVRAHWYGLLAHYLARPPHQDSLELARGLEGDDTPLGKSVAAFAAAARAATVETADEEFHKLFYGVGRGELVPHGSFYLTGFLNEKPLAELRKDLAQLGVARADDVKFFEDLEGAKASTLYMPLGAIGRQFIEIEIESFRMLD